MFHEVGTGWFEIPHENEFFSLPHGLLYRRVRFHFYDTVIGVMDSDIQVYAYDRHGRQHELVPRTAVECWGLNVAGEKDYDGTLISISREMEALVRGR